MGCTGRAFGFVLTMSLTVVGSVSAANLVGRVTNGTTKKPAATDEVVLLVVSERGAKEIARATTDRSGNFSFTVADTPVPHLVRVIHQGVAYEKTAESAVGPIVVQVYDVVDKLDGVAAVMDVQRLEATKETLEVKQLVTMRNASRPPHTLMTDRSFEIQLPPEAQVKYGLVQVEDGQPLRDKPIPGEQKGSYYFRCPLRPGDTRFGLVYQLPYTGQIEIEPRIRNSDERFVVMLPKSMRFEPRAAGVFQPMSQVSPDDVLGTAPVAVGQTVAFRVLGTGVLAELQGQKPPARSDGVQPTAKLGTSSTQFTVTRLRRADEAVLSGLVLALMVFVVVYVRKNKMSGRAGTTYKLLPSGSHRQRDQKDDRKKYGGRLKAQNAFARK